MGATIDSGLIRNLLLAIGEIDLHKRKEKALLTETWFHKILFDLKKRVESQKIQDSLQFYWYKHGPYCEPIREELIKLVGAKIFSKIENDNGLIFYQLDKKPQFIKNKYFSDSKIVLEEIISETDLFRLRSKVKEIYAGAPYVFMPNYKIDYLEIIREYRELIEIEKDNKKFLDGYKERVVKSLYECESLLPFDDTFSEFNQVFANMVGEITTCLSLNKDTDLFLLDECYKVSVEAWDCFAKGVRLEHHDQFYDDKVQYWENDFSDSVKRFTKTVALFNEELLEKYSGLSLKEIEPQTDANTIMKAIVLGYTHEE